MLPQRADPDLARAGELCEQLRAAVAAIATGDETGPTLDRRDRPLRELAALGVTHAALAELAQLPVGEVARLVRGVRPPGRGHNPRLTALLRTLVDQGASDA